MEKKKVRLETLLPAMEETLASGGTVKLPITGTSMLPLLVQGRDFVLLKKPEGKLQKLDLPFYRRKDGAFVLHRVVKVEENTYTMCGDNQWILEPGIEDGQILGIVTHIVRNGKEFPVTSKKYRRYVRIWHSLLPIRKFFVKLRGVKNRLKRMGAK